MKEYLSNNKTDKLIHENTPNVVCPHCGYEDSDWFEGYDISDGSVNSQGCMSCSKPFNAYVSVTVEFTTEKTTYEEISMKEIEDFERSYLSMKDFLSEGSVKELEGRLKEMIEGHSLTDWSEWDE